MMSDWHDIGTRIVGLVAKEPPFIQIAVSLAVAFTALMILEGLRASFVPRRSQEADAHDRPVRSADPFAASAKVARLPRNPKRHQAVVKQHLAPKPIIRREGGKPPEG